MPSLSQYAAEAPVVYEEEVAPVAPPPVEETYVAPPPEAGGGGSLSQYAAEQPYVEPDYTAAPTEAPTEFIPGSTYRPLSIQDEQAQMEQAPVKPPPTNISALPAESAVPVDPFSGIGDVAGTVRDAATSDENLLTKAKNVGTTFLDVPGMWVQNTKNVEGQRAKDQALYGDADKTVDLTPESLGEAWDQKGNILNPAIMTSAFINEFESVPDAIPSSTKQQLNEYYADPVEGPARVAEAQAREKTEGVAAWEAVWKEGEGMTLESGGWTGMGRGAIRDIAADPSSFISAGGNALGDALLGVARNSGKIGTVRGGEMALKGANIALDPIFEGTTTGLAALGKKVAPEWFTPGAKVAGGIANEKVVEAVDMAVSDVQRQSPRSTHSPIPFEPLALPETASMNSGQSFTNTRVATETDLAGSPPPARTPVTPYGQKLVRVSDPDGGELTAWDTGKVPTIPEMERAEIDLIDVHPNDFVPGQYGHTESQNTLMRGVMTQENFMYDNWPASRREVSMKNAQEYAKRTGDTSAITKEKARLDAGVRGIKFQRRRLAKWGDVELQRVVDNIQRQGNDRVNAIANLDPVTYRNEMDKIQRDVGNKIEALSEALDSSSHNQSFELTVGNFPYRHWANTDTIIRPRMKGTIAMDVPRFNTLQYDNPLGQVEGFGNASDYDGTITNLMNVIGITPDPARPNLQQEFINLVQDPDAFKYGSDAKSAIARDVREGVLAPERAEQLRGHIDLRRYLAKKGLYNENPIGGVKKGNKLYTQGNDAQISHRLIRDMHTQFTKDWGDSGDVGELEAFLAQPDVINAPTGYTPSPERYASAPTKPESRLAGDIENPNPLPRSEENARFDKFTAVDDYESQRLDEIMAEPSSMKRTQMLKELDAELSVRRTTSPIEAEPVSTPPASKGIRTIENADGTFSVEADGVVLGRASSKTAADKMAAKAEGTVGTKATPIDNIETPATPMRQASAKSPDPEAEPRRYIAQFPNLAGKLDEASQAAGRPTLMQRARNVAYRNPKKVDVGTTRLRAVNDADFIDDPEYANSGLARGVTAFLDQIDADKPMSIDGKKIRMYTYIKQTTAELQDMPGLVRRAANYPKDAKLQRAVKEINQRYAPTMKEFKSQFDTDDIANLTDDQMRQVITTHVASEWGKLHIPKEAVGRRGVIQDVTKLVKNVVDFRRGVGLTSYGAAPRQILNQYVGNVWGLFMGKPSAMIDMLDMGELRRHVQNLHMDGTNPNIQMKELMGGYGASAPNPMLSGGTRTYAGHEVEVTGALGKLRDFVAPKWLRDWVSGPDELAKGGVAGSTFRKGMRREVDALPENAKLTAGRMGQRRQGMEVITARIDKKLPQALEKYRTPHFDRPQFTGEQLEKEILDIFKGDVQRGTVNRDSLRVYADRMKRDWNTVVNSEKQYAAAEVKRVMFSWDNTKADDVIQNIFLYHYWATRAGFLYSKEMLKKPYLMTLYMDSAEQIQQEAEMGDYPTWMTGFTRILNSPAGVALFLSPLDMISTAFHLNEMEMGGVDEAGNSTLTALGQLKGMFPFVWNPALELALSYAGAFGPGQGMPNNMTGLNRSTGIFADVINWANFNGMLGNLGKDQMGNPIPLAPRPLDDAILKVAAHFGMPITPSSASFEKETTVYLQERIVQANGGMMDPMELNETVAEMYERAQAGDVDPMLMDAQADALANSMQGPEFDFLPEGLRPVVGAAARYLSPVRMTARSEFGAKMQYPGMENTLGGDPSILSQMIDAGYDENQVKGTKRAPFQTERAKSLDVARQLYYQGGDPELANVKGTFDDIGHNSIGAPINVGGVDYSVADINAMADKERWDLADDWLGEQGYDRKSIDAFYEEQQRIIAENPDVGGFIAFKQYAEGYPGGTQAFVDEAVKTSPSYALYMQKQGQPGTPQYYEFATSPDAYFAINGEQAGVYGAINPGPAGIIPGLPAGSNFLVKYQTDKEIEAALDSGENGFTEFVSTVQEDVDQIYYAQEWLNVNYPGVKAGAWLDKAVYNQMKEAGVAAPKPEDAGTAYEYFDWFANNATAPDLSVEAFLDQRPSTGKASESLPSPSTTQIANQAGVATATSAPIAKDELQRMGIASTPIQNIELRSGPSQSNPSSLSIPMGAPLKEVYRGADGWSQVYIPVIGGYKIGWVETATLQAA